jgi:hypothetical protein
MLSAIVVQRIVNDQMGDAVGDGILPFTNWTDQQISGFVLQRNAA